MTGDSSPGSFVEVCLYDVKADKAADFEELIRRVLAHHSAFPGVRDVKYVKRTHRPVDFAGARSGEPAIRLSRPAETLTYVLYWELDDAVVHAAATKSGLESFYRDFRRCLAKPPKIILGERVR